MNCASSLLRESRRTANSKRAEPYTLSAIEAGLYGKSLVITKNGGVLDYFGKDAYYVDPFNIESIENGINEALKNPKDLSEKLLKLLDPRALGEELGQVYNMAIEKKRK